MVRDLHFMSFINRSSTDTDMIGSSKILVCVALVFATTVSSDERSRRSDLIDLGTSILLPWESASNARLRNTIYNRGPSTDILRLKNIGGQDLNERNELQLALRNLGRLSNEYGNRQQYLARGASNLDLSQNSQRNGLVQKGLRQNGYAGLGSYSTFTNNQEEEQATIEEIRQRQAQYLDQSRTNKLAEQNRNIAQRNVQLGEVASLRSQSYGNNVESASPAADILNANRWSKYNQLANSGILAGNGQQRTSGYSQVNQVNRDLNQQDWRNTGRLVALNKLGQNNAQSYDALNEQELLRSSQESVDADVQQNNYNAERLRSLQSLRALNNRHLYRPIAVNQGAALENANIEQQPLNAELNAQEPSTQVLEIRPEQLSQNNLGSNSGVLVNSYQPQYQALQAGLNQQQPNDVYTYGELNAKIWNVIKSNPAMMSNLDNLREQLLSGRDSGNDQMRQLKGLLQEARQYNRNVLIPANRIVAQSPEEQERNAVVANLIDAMNTNEIISRGHVAYGGWRA